MNVWVYHSTLLPSKERHEVKGHPETSLAHCGTTKVLARTCHRSELFFQHSGICIIQVSFRPFGAKECHEEKNHAEIRFSPTAAPPKHLIKQTIAGNCFSNIGQAEYGYMSLSFKSPSIRLGPKSVMMWKVIPKLAFLPPVAPPKYFIKHAIGLYWSSNIVQAEYVCMSVSFKSSAFKRVPWGEKSSWNWVFCHCGTTKVLHQTCHRSELSFANTASGIWMY